MQSVISEIYRSGCHEFVGSLNPASDYSRLFRKVDKMEGEFKLGLTEAQREAFEQYLRESGRLNSMESEGEFIAGFRLGVRLMAEVFSGGAE